MEERKGKVVHHTVGVCVLMSSKLSAHREALDTEVKVGALGALDAHDLRDIARTVVAVVE